MLARPSRQPAYYYNRARGFLAVGEFIMRPLFGLSCLDKAVPPGTNIQCAAALLEAPSLCAIFELVPEFDLTPDAPGPSPSIGPNPEPNLGNDYQNRPRPR